MACEMACDLDGEYYSEIPCLDFSGEVALDSSDSTSEAWKQELRGKVREACENHGCFLVEYNNNTSKIPLKLVQDMLMAMKPLFDLPQHTKNKYSGTGRFDRYLCSPFSSIHESFGIEDPHRLDMARSFTNLMWPANGNPSFWYLTTLNFF